MIIIDLSFKIKDLKGKELTSDDGKCLSAGELVADRLAKSTENTSKFMAWATKLTFDKTIEVDDTDLDLLGEFIQKKAVLSNLIKEPIRIYFKQLKEKKKENKVN